MEVGTVSALEAGTNSPTMAAQLPAAAAKHAGKPALRQKAGDAWRDVSYEELGGAVRELSLGLIDLGIAPGDRVAILSNTRPEWTLACYGILTAGDQPDAAHDLDGMPLDVVVAADIGVAGGNRVLQLRQ